MRRKTLRWAALALALAGLTCRDNHPIGPGAAGRAVFDVRAFALFAPGDPPVPVESLDVVFRRTDESLAFADTVDLAAAAQGDSFVVSLDVPLDETPQDFLLTLRAFGGGIDWYEADTVVALAQGANAPLAPLGRYVGPGANAASVLLVIPTTRVVGGVATPLSAIVHDSSGAPLSGVPVGFRVGNAGVATVSGALLNSATVTGAQPIRDSTWVYAETPTHLRDSVRVHVVPPPTTLDSVSGGGQAGPPGVPLPAPFVVRVRDGLGDPFAGATVTWAVTGGTGTLSATTTVTDASGLASVTLTPVSLGVITVQATAPGLAGSPRTFAATGGAGPAASLAKISGDNQTGAGGAALGQPLVVEVRDAFSNPVANATVNWATTSGGSFAPASGLTGANGQAQTTWTLGPSAPSQVATATVGALAPVTFSATAIVGTPAISLSFAGVPGVGVGLSAKVYVDLNQPAPAGGIAISLASDNTSIFTVAPPNLTIPQGMTRDSATVSGVSPGQGTLTATGSGYASGTLSVVVQNRNIAVPLTLNVPYGQTASLPIQLPAPAPVGGVTFSVASSDPSRVGVSTPSVTITGGSQAANATLTGVLPGAATITVSNPAYIDGVTAATTTASLNIVQGSASLNASFGTSIGINFESNGTPTAAPAPGISVALTSSDLSCLAATSPVTIATGLVSTTATLTYGGSAPLPCTTKLLAQATNLLADSINVTVNPVPGITVGTLTVGSG
ncbi:MAG TPA: Ig-like domain-containing protein, partial [Gemmatimonadales bacterium]|nr:Ig-like domain-containing protein [Gemmatimonadales bacterium]